MSILALVALFFLSPSATAQSETQPAPATAITSEVRADILVARKRYLNAIDIYQQAPPSARIENKIGIAFHEMSLVELARKHYEKAVKMDHNFAEAINNLGTTYYANHNYSRAIQLFKRSLKCSGPVALVYSNLGAAYFNRRDYRQASHYFDQALKLDPEVLDNRHGGGILVVDRSIEEIALFHLYLAKTYAKAGADEKALTYLRKALEEGLKDRKKLANLPEFSLLRTNPAFLDLLKENPQPL
jgi:tetratricopeptide (TPR) repeat protein